MVNTSSRASALGPVDYFDQLREAASMCSEAPSVGRLVDGRSIVDADRQNHRLPAQSMDHNLISESALQNLRTRFLSGYLLREYPGAIPGSNSRGTSDWTLARLLATRSTGTLAPSIGSSVSTGTLAPCTRLECRGSSVKLAPMSDQPCSPPWSTGPPIGNKPAGEGRPPSATTSSRRDALC
jgi:hypothetical protein